MKRKPGQVVLDALEWQLNGLHVVDGVEIRQAISELRAWRKAFKKMAGAGIMANGYGDGKDCLYNDEELEIVHLIIRAREIEEKRK